ncbi:MAG: 1-acyl-sn-glycerol-3-phosphate acyltransferase [Lachnospiraceae bacterium]|nr:1-acyl-sn-glycerol-3-phosphate acyltransferase [Lachnospiraceae bacterium]
MLRFYYVIIISIPFIIYYIMRMRFMMRRLDKYTDEQCYRVARGVCRQVMINARIRTKIFGTENLPEEGGYVMYPNHQGKFDALGIIYSHKKPCTVVMDEKRSHMPIANEVIGVLRGIRLDKTDMRGQVESIRRITAEVKEGRKYILFPEGGYYHNRNNVQEFMPGAFKAAVQAKSPIVPVALIDSYKPFELNSLRKVTTQVHFLKPLYYDEYKDMNTRQIAEEVRKRIIDAMKEALGVKDLDKETFEVTEKDLRQEDKETWKHGEQRQEEL